MLSPRWLKEGKWESLTSVVAFFEQVIGFRPSEFKRMPTRKAGRVIDNHEAAKARLAFIGFANEAMTLRLEAGRLPSIGKSSV